MSLSTYRLIVAGLLVPTSYTLFGNLGYLVSGADSPRLTPLQRVAIWRSFYEAGKRHLFVPYVAALPVWAVLQRQSYSSVSSRWLLRLTVAGFVSTVLTIPFSGLFLLPINTQLCRIDDQQDIAAAQDFGVALIHQWYTYHRIRMLLYAVTWATTVALLVLA